MLTSPSSLTRELAKLLAPLAAWAAMAVFAARELDPSGAAESGYLALVATAVLLAVAALAPWPAPEAGLGSVLAVTAVWALPPGPGRGAAVMLLLVAALAVAAARRLSRTLPELPLEVSVPLFLGVQLLMRGELLFAAELNPRALVALLALPAVAAGAATLLARRHGGVLALIAAGTAVLLAPGWNVSSTLSMVALAVGDLLRWPGLRWPVKAAAALALLAPVAWEPGLGLVATIAGLAMALPWAGPLPAVALVLYQDSMGWEGRASMLPLLFLLLPILGQAFFRFDKARTLQILTAVLLFPSVYMLPNWGLLAAPLGLAALALDRKGPALTAQGVWTSALAGGTALLASYPWLRQAPTGEILWILGLRGGWMPAVVAFGVGLAFAALTPLAPLSRHPSHPPRERGELEKEGFFSRVRGGAPLPGRGSWGGGRGVGGEGLLAAGLIFLALLFHLPSPGTTLLPEETAVVLNPGNPSWESPLPSGSIKTVVLDSALANGAGLEHGTPVATVRLERAGAPGREWTLRAGQGTGEWAARRPDVQAAARLQSPPAWISWVAAEGFFAQRYRALWQVERPGPFARLRVERVPGLSPDVTIALHQVEVRR